MEIQHQCLQQQIENMRGSLFYEEIVDGHFLQLEKLQDRELNPNFVEEIITLYIGETQKVIATIEEGLEGPLLDHHKLNKYLHQLKGSSGSIGANKVTIETNKAIQCWRKDDIEGCRAAVPRLKQEYNNLKSIFEAYFKVIRQLARIAKTSKDP